MSGYRLAVCAEMVFLDLPFPERVRRIADLGFEVEMWNWAGKDIDALAGTGATFSSMTGYLRGTLADIAARVHEAGVRRTATIVVGPALAARGFRDSHLYSKARLRD